MTYTLGTKCAKNPCKRIVLLQLITENVVTCFWNTVCFATPNGMAIFRREPPPHRTGASNARGYKNHDFRPISRSVSETMQDRVE